MDKIKFDYNLSKIEELVNNNKYYDAIDLIKEQLLKIDESNLGNRFNNGIEYSNKCFKGATALEDTISYISLLFLLYISALSFITLISFKSNLLITIFIKSHFFAVESMRVILRLG